MRLFEFSQPQSDIVSSIEDLIQFVQTGDNSDPDYAIVADLIGTINDAVNTQQDDEVPVDNGVQNTAPVQKQPPVPQRPEPQVAQQPAPQPAPQVTNGTLSERTVDARAAKAKAAELQDDIQTDPTVRAFLKSLPPELRDKAIQMARKVHNKGIATGKQREFEASTKFDKRISDLADVLANKVFGNLVTIADAEMAAADNAEEKANAGKKKKEASKFQPLVKEVIKHIFSQGAKGEESLAEAEELRQLTIKFMEACNPGIFAFEDLLTQRGGNIHAQITDPGLLRVYKKIQKDILSIKPNVTGAGAWGPGELGLALLATPVQKGTTGDLKVGDKEVELKASKVSTKGGRFNSKAATTGIAAKEAYTKAFTEMITGIGSLIYKKTSANKLKDDVLGYRTKTGDKAGKLQHVNFKNLGYGLIEQLNNKLIGPASKVDPNTTKTFMRMYFRQAMEAVIIKDARHLVEPEIKSFATDNKVFVKQKDGGFLLDANVIRDHVVNILYRLYMEYDGKGTIFILNPTTGSFSVCDNPAELISNINKGVVDISTSFIDFGADQSKASPQVGIK